MYQEDAKIGFKRILFVLSYLSYEDLGAYTHTVMTFQ